MTIVPKEPFRELVVLNTGGYHAQFPGADPTEGGSICTEKLQETLAQASHCWSGDFERST